MSMLSCMNFVSHINTVENTRKCLLVCPGGGGHRFKLRFAAAIASAIAMQPHDLSAFFRHIKGNNITTNTIKTLGRGKA